MVTMMVMIHWCYVIHQHYHKSVKFINLSMSTLGIMGKSSDSFLSALGDSIQWKRTTSNYHSYYQHFDLMQLPCVLLWEQALEKPRSYGLFNSPFSKYSQCSLTSRYLVVYNLLTVRYTIIKSNSTTWSLKKISPSW